VYETLSGWEESLDTVAEIGDLPDAARRYVRFVESELEVEVSVISIGAERERVVTPRGLASVAGQD
jgi:adenylosuccinate synthase